MNGSQEIASSEMLTGLPSLQWTNLKNPIMILLSNILFFHFRDSHMRLSTLHPWGRSYSVTAMNTTRRQPQLSCPNHGVEVLLLGLSAVHHRGLRIQLPVAVLTVSLLRPSLRRLVRPTGCNLGTLMEHAPRGCSSKLGGLQPREAVERWRRGRPSGMQEPAMPQKGETRVVVGC